MHQRVIVRHGDGGTVVVRRRHTLKSQRKGTPAVSGLLLMVNGAHLAGVTSLSLHATQLTGVLPKGCRFTIAGNPTIYTASAAAEAVSGALAVPLTTALAANAADGAAVTFTQPYADYSFFRQRGRVDADVLDSGERESTKSFHLSALTTTGEAFEPLPGDLLVVGSSERRIAQVQEINPGGGAVRWRIDLGAA
jgi:hypothetical protein